MTSGEKQIPQPNSYSSNHQLEQWIYFLGNDQDLAAPLNSFVAANKEIKEVHDMLHTLTKNDTLREKYRLHEEWLQVRQGEGAQRMQLEKALIQERLARERDRITRKWEKAALKKELNRKGKALAETAALLVLKKTADSIWGDPREVL